MTEEIWKDIKGYEGKYQVSNLGNVKSLNYNNKIGVKKNLSKVNSTKGYFIVYLWKNNKKKNKYVHRLVAGAFIPNPKNLPLINHKNGKKKDNYVENLEWCTQKENMRHAWDNNLINLNTPNVRRARERGLKKSIEKRKKSVNQYDLNGNFIKRWDKIIDATNELKIHDGSITECCKGRKKTAGGYIWKYDNNSNNELKDSDIK